MGKPRGIRCARKLRVHRREALWADKDGTWPPSMLMVVSSVGASGKLCSWVWQDYKKANLGTKYKCNPFGGALLARNSMGLAASLPSFGEHVQAPPTPRASSLRRSASKQSSSKVAFSSRQAVMFVGRAASL